MKKFIALIILCIALGTVAVYVIYEKKQEDEWIKLKVGRWRKASVVKKDMNSPEMDKLLSLPYLGGYHKAPINKGTTIYKKELVFDGLNFYCSGHAPEAGIMDMEGNVIHTWTYDILQNLWPNVGLKEESSHWRRAYLCENGDLIAIYPDIGIIKLDKNSKLLWSYKCAPHHYIQVTKDNDVFVLTREIHEIPDFANKSVRIDFITVLNSKGEFIKKYSLLECFNNSSYAYLLEKKKKRKRREIFHTNTMHILDGRLEHVSSLFKKGNVVISPIALNCVAIVDLEKKKVVWALEGRESGLWKGLHETILLDNGNILLFSNQGNTQGFGKSKVIEFNPITEELIWEYTGEKNHPFFSESCGTNQRLPNGNTLITESDNGRAFEVTKGGEIVWEYVSPHRAGSKNELIATLLHVERLEREKVKWLITAKVQ